MGDSVPQELVDTISKQILASEKLHDLVEKSKAKVILIGEASHGTADFYDNRCELTKSLIESGRCQAILIEGDFPKTAELHRYVCGFNNVPNSCLDSFAQEFPDWMWANTSMKKFLIWLKRFNSTLPVKKRCGIFGLDIYSLQHSIEKVLQYLKKHDDLAFKNVQESLSCFQRFGSHNKLDPQLYGMLTSGGLVGGCEDAALNAMQVASAAVASIRQALGDLNNIAAKDECFFVEMNARVIADAEHYYRAMFDQQESSWNVRDRHFFAILQKTRDHLLSTRGAENCVVWAHNSHLGDARFTHLETPPKLRELNMGQLVKENMGDEAIIIGQLTYTGEVRAADDWGSESKVKTVNEGLPGSYEALFHAVTNSTKQPEYCLDLRAERVENVLNGARLQRAIGVVYRPDTERQHYYLCDITRQFDLLNWVDCSSAVVPLNASVDVCDSKTQHLHKPILTTQQTMAL